MKAVDFSGVWRSIYSYPSSSRQSDFADEHIVRITQKGETVTVETVPGSPSDLRIDLTLEGDVLTGIWRERTDPKGYYKGRTFYGAIQLVSNPQKSRLEGRWIGVDSHGVVQHGPWELMRDENARPGLASS